ncbi:MAG TPA: sugar-binding protein [Planctomycetota bacterium]|nr:sugar-binding protein [Planctomycetota bacterium]
MRLIALIATAALASAGEAVPVIPFAESAPAVDGALGDACWSTALTLDGFTVVSASTPYPKRIVARAVAHGDTLYVAVECAEPDTTKLKRGTKAGAGVWNDDCVEIFVRAGDARTDGDQFLVNVDGAAEAVRRRGGRPVDPVGDTWRAVSRVDGARWIVEFALPAADIGLDGLRRGDALGLKIGREDHTGPALGLAVWPPGVAFAPGADARVAIGDVNLLAASDGGEARPWGGAIAGMEPMPGVGMRFTAAAATQQDLRLRPGRPYRLAVEAESAAPASLRVRVAQGDGQPDEKVDLAIPAGATGATLSRRFIAGPTGKALLVLRVEDPAGGATTLRDLRVVADDAPRATGAAIPLPPTTLVVRTVRPVDCRSQRGFTGAPIDGTTASGSWDGLTWEYNQPNAGGGIAYGWLGNDGLHVRLADAQGVDAVVVRGGVKAQLWRDVPGPDSSDGGTRVWEFPGGVERSRALFPERVASDRFSFFAVGDGRIADVSFYRIERAAAALPGKPRPFPVSPRAGSAAPATAAWMGTRFAEADRATLTCAEDGGGAIELPAGRAVHLLLPPLPEGVALAAVGVVGELAEPAPGAEIEIAVQDPLQPRFQLHGADYALGEGVGFHLVCDHADQIAQAGAQPWLTLVSDRPLRFARLRVELHEIEPDAARAEALAHRRLLLKALYQPLSEARPWNEWGRQARVDEYLAKDEPFPRLVREMVATLAHCRRIDAHDDIVRQYHEWIFRGVLRRDPGPMPPFATRLDRVDGVPAWASLARQAWSQARAVPAWWIATRQAPNGEFGGEIGDDTDLLMNFSSFPWMEDAAVGAQVRDAGRRLMDLADRHTLIDGLNRHTMDPLHAYEEGVNLAAQMLVWNPGDPAAVERCMAATRGLEALTVRTADGHRHFRHWEIGAGQVQDPPPPTDEHGSHFLMLHPALELARWNRDPRAMALLTEWADGWLEHPYAENLTLPGDTPDGLATEPFPGMWTMMGSIFVAMAELTGDAKYVRPYLDQLAAGKAIGQRQHLSEMLQLGMLDPALARTFVEQRWELALLLDGATGALERQLASDIEELQRFPHMYTTVECFTDRVFMDPIHAAATAYTGGYATRNKLNHTYGVAWEGFGDDLAALVRDNRRDRLALRARNLGARDVDGRVRVLRLAHGRYRITSGVDADDDGAPDAGAAVGEAELARGSTVPLALAAGAQVALAIELIAPLEDIALRADLGLSSVTVADGTVRGVIHSLGHVGAGATAVALVDAAGTEIARVAVPALAAPADLKPITTAFSLAGLPQEHAGCSVVIDPDKALAEISRDNNRMPVP